MLSSAAKQQHQQRFGGSFDSTSETQVFQLRKGVNELWLNRGMVKIETTWTLPEAAARVRTTQMTTRRRAAQATKQAYEVADKKATAARLLAAQRVSPQGARPAEAARVVVAKAAALVKAAVLELVREVVRVLAKVRGQAVVEVAVPAKVAVLAEVVALEKVVVQAQALEAARRPEEAHAGKAALAAAAVLREAAPARPAEARAQPERAAMLVADAAA